MRRRNDGMSAVVERVLLPPRWVRRCITLREYRAYKALEIGPELTQRIRGSATCEIAYAA